jgi:hypothetical protein
MKRMTFAASACLLAVTLAACSGGGSSGSKGNASTSGTAATSTAASGGKVSANPPSAKPLPPLDLRPSVGKAPAPASATGYTYGTASAAAVHAAATVTRQFSQVTVGRVVRGVNKQGHRIGDFVSYGVDPKYVASPIFRGQFLASLVGGLASSTTPTTNESVAETSTTVATGKTTAAMGWVDGNTIFVIMVPVKSIADARAFVSAYPRAH